MRFRWVRGEGLEVGWEDRLIEWEIFCLKIAVCCAWLVSSRALMTLAEKAERAKTMILKEGLIMMTLFLYSHEITGVDVSNFKNVYVCIHKARSQSSSHPLLFFQQPLLAQNQKSATLLPSFFFKSHSYSRKLLYKAIYTSFLRL